MKKLIFYLLYVRVVYCENNETFNQDGRFKPILRKCLYKRKDPLLAVAFMNSSVLGDTMFPHGSIIVARCKHFGLYKLTGDNMMRCENGEWEAKWPTCVPTSMITNYTDVVCPPIDAPSPYVRKYAQGSHLGNAIHYSCEPGFRLNGSAVVNCMGDGRWSSQPPTCVETFCPLRTLGPHLSVVEYNSSYGGRVVFACSWGYRLRGPPGLECEQDGKWSGDMPQCVPIYCPDPLIPEKGRLLNAPSSKDGKYPVGDLIMYACEDDVEIVGESSIVCTENGFWSHPPPFCLPPSEIKKTDTIYVDNTTLVNFEE